MFEIVYDDPVSVYERSYKIYYRQHYLIGILVNAILAIGACFTIFLSPVPILGYLILAFSGIYIAVYYFFYYVWVRNSMKKRKNGLTRIVVDEDEIYIFGVETEIKIKLTALRSAYRYDSYVNLMFNNNLFVTVDLEQLNEDSRSWFLEKVNV